MILKIPERFIRQDSSCCIRQYYINPDNIILVDVSWFTLGNGDGEPSASVGITMSNGAGPILKSMSVTELQDFILWWNQALNLEKLHMGVFTDENIS